MGQKAVELHRHADKRLKAPENWKPSPVSDLARHPYMLMNLGQRDEPLSEEHPAEPSMAEAIVHQGLGERHQ